MYTEIEKKLIEKGLLWRKNPNFERSAASSYDNTPFEDYQGLQVRATKEYSGWVFKAIARKGYTGMNCGTLQESINIALAEKKNMNKE